MQVMYFYTKLSITKKNIDFIYVVLVCNYCLEAFHIILHESTDY